MTGSQSRWLKAGLAGLLLAVGLPLLGHWIRHGGSASRCALDGRRIEPASHVRILTGEGQSLTFCCIHCAEIWLTRQKTRPQAVLVTDESSGAEIKAADAFFVRSLVQNPATGDRIHVFRSEEDAEHHAERFHGSLLSGHEIPLLHGAPAKSG